MPDFARPILYIRRKAWAIATLWRDPNAKHDHHASRDAAARSLLAGIPTNELDTEDTVDQTSARSGADVDILGITQPSETTCTAAGCRDELLVGESTTFEVVMKNIGTGDVEDMSYSWTST